MSATLLADGADVELVVADEVFGECRSAGSAATDAIAGLGIGAPFAWTTIEAEARIGVLVGVAGTVARVVLKSAEGEYEATVGNRYYVVTWPADERPSVLVGIGENGEVVARAIDPLTEFGQ